MPDLWEKTGDAKDNSDLQKVELSTLVISEPTVIFISGWPSHDKNPDAMSKDINFIRRALANHPEIESLPKIYSWSHKDALSAIFNVVPYNYQPDLQTPAAQDLARGVIMPLVSEAGQPLPHEEAKKRLRNLTFFNTCAGTVVGQQVYNAAAEMMKEIGYKPEEVRELLHEVTTIAVAAMSVPREEQDRFSTLTLINSDDDLVGVKNMLYPLRNIFSKTGGPRPLKIEQLSDTSVLVTAATRREKWDWGKSKEVIDGVRLPRWHIVFKNKKGTHINFNHELVPEYFNYNDNSSQISRIVPYALVNAINRTETNPVKLLEPLRDAPDHYQRKITKALSQ